MTLAPKALTANNLQQFFGKTLLVWRVGAAVFASGKLVPNFEILLQKW
jgi:hypothetical protein